MTSFVIDFDSSKKKLPVSTDQFQFKLTVHYPRVILNQFQDDLMLYYYIKAIQKLIYHQFCHLFWIALKKETPCFHRLVSIQIYSPLPQGVNQPISRRSDVALQNKSPPKSHVLSVQPVILDNPKKETPCFHKLLSIHFSSRIPQGDTQPVSRRSDVALKHKISPKTHM